MKNLTYLPLLALVFFLVTCQSSDVATNKKTAKASFVANPQPVAKQEVKTDRIKAIVTDYKDKSVDLIAITPNSPLGLRYDELGYTDLNDDFATMKPRAEHHNFNFPYLYDGDTEEASLKYGPVATPHAFVFDKARKLQYVGRLDKLEHPDKGANAEDLRTAIEEVLAGQPVTTPKTKTFGCSTKWAWKTDYNDKADAAWAARPITVEPIDEPGVKALLKNEDSDKLRLINVWATWCGKVVWSYQGDVDFLELKRAIVDHPMIGRYF